MWIAWPGVMRHIALSCDDLHCIGAISTLCNNVRIFPVEMKKNFGACQRSLGMPGVEGGDRSADSIPVE
jgi:hypothetical protein